MYLIFEQGRLYVLTTVSNHASAAVGLSGFLVKTFWHMAAALKMKSLIN